MNTAILSFQEAMGVVNNATALIVESKDGRNNYLCYGKYSEDDGFLETSADTDYESDYFMAELNQNISCDGSSIYLTNSKGVEFKITLLTPILYIMGEE